MTDIALDEKTLAETQVEFDNVPPGLVEAIVAAWNRRSSPSQVAPANPAQVTDADFSDYDAGILNDFGGGNVAWWQDYLRAEIGRANEFWREQIAALAAGEEDDGQPDEVQEWHDYDPDC